jgi:hypothetical protein
MVTPPTGVSVVSLTTVRPRKEVVTGMTFRAGVAAWDTGMPLTVAVAEIVRLAVPAGWLTGAAMVRIDVWPAVIC